MKNKLAKTFHIKRAVYLINFKIEHKIESLIKQVTPYL